MPWYQVLDQIVERMNNMLSEKLGSERGHVTSRRVLPGEGMRYMKLEISFESEGEVMGVKGQNIGTFTVVERGPGQMYAEGQGIVMLETGEGGIWNGHGVGQMSEDGTIRIASAIAVQTTSEKLASINHQLLLAETHAHPDGAIHADFYGWTAPAH
jgi:hypothetical protein